MWILQRDGILGGKPYVRGTRLTVEFIREQIAAGASREDLLVAHPQLTPEGLDAARRYVAQKLHRGVLRSHRPGRRLAKSRSQPGPLGYDSFSSHD